ncbi:hypothetical protein EYF80_020006 [Liparis tanakae]|uniref:Uncharacterized protein n=1 Tax=Liparis tanakae TaxID=230148 RepID=A0A4Z2HXM1_9TELE|nr:hypothetical protein EYF80_020006 [Liparis tanakae]
MSLSTFMNVNTGTNTQLSPRETRLVSAVTFGLMEGSTPNSLEMVRTAVPFSSHSITHVTGSSFQWAPLWPWGEVEGFKRQRSGGDVAGGSFRLKRKANRKSNVSSPRSVTKHVHLMLVCKRAELNNASNLSTCSQGIKTKSKDVLADSETKPK